MAAARAARAAGAPARAVPAADAGGTKAAAEASRRHDGLVAARVEQLLHHLQPSFASEVRRLAVAEYVCGIIRRCFYPRQVEAFMFGSVPLRTVLPDGDIDLSVFCPPPPGGSGAALWEIWAMELLRALEREQAAPNPVFTIADVHIIQAEVRLVKCIVADLVVDISFDTLGGLCTVAFLEAVDRRIGQGHLFKRSIVLVGAGEWGRVKAWCYYESRLLGAHHGLISSYALETMVLYVINFHHAELATPLDVLRKFLRVFAEFSWETHCLSIHGPIPLRSFPHPAVDTAALPAEGLLLDEQFMAEALQAYSVRPTAQPTIPGPGPAAAANGAGAGADGQAPPTPAPAAPAVVAVAPAFPLKHLNVVDPLLPSNNLGRSVSRASFARIRQAFMLGARTLEQAAHKESARAAVEAVDAFFKNTWRSPMRTSADNQLFLHRLGAAAGSGFAGGPPGIARSGSLDSLAQAMLAQQQQAAMVQLLSDSLLAQHKAAAAAAAAAVQQQGAAAAAQQRAAAAAVAALPPAPAQQQQQAAGGAAVGVSVGELLPGSLSAASSPTHRVPQANGSGRLSTPGAAAAAAAGPGATAAADQGNGHAASPIASSPLQGAAAGPLAGGAAAALQAAAASQASLAEQLLLQQQARGVALQQAALAPQSLVARTSSLPHLAAPPAGAALYGLAQSALAPSPGAALGLSLHSLLASGQLADALAGDLPTLARNLLLARHQQAAAPAPAPQWRGGRDGPGGRGRGGYMRSYSTGGGPRPQHYQQGYQFVQQQQAEQALQAQALQAQQQQQQQQKQQQVAAAQAELLRPRPRRLGGGGGSAASSRGGTPPLPAGQAPPAGAPPNAAPAGVPAVPGSGEFPQLPRPAGQRPSQPPSRTSSERALAGAGSRSAPPSAAADPPLKKSWSAVLLNPEPGGAEAGGASAL
eukprot:scaffold22.g6096.t1